MKFHTWYNPQLDKYKTDYRQSVSDYPFGYTDKRGHILIGSVYFYKDKVFFSREAQEKHYQRLCAKNRVKKKLINFINKL